MGTAPALASDTSKSTQPFTPGIATISETSFSGPIKNLMQCGFHFVRNGTVVRPASMLNMLKRSLNKGTPLYYQSIDGTPTEFGIDPADITRTRYNFAPNRDTQISLSCRLNSHGIAIECQKVDGDVDKAQAIITRVGQMEKNCAALVTARKEQIKNEGPSPAANSAFIRDVSTRLDLQSKRFSKVFVITALER